MKTRTKGIIIAASAIAAVAFSFAVHKLTFVVTGSPVTEKIIFPNALPWNYSLIYNYKDYDYSVTRMIIPPDEVDQKIDTAAWNGPQGERYDVYSIKNVQHWRQLAIQTRYGYLLANRANRALNRAVVTASGSVK